MPQTNDVLKFTQLIGPFYEFVDDDRAEQNGTVSLPKKKSNKKKLNTSNQLANGTGGGLN